MIASAPIVPNTFSDQDIATIDRSVEFYIKYRGIDDAILKIRDNFVDKGYWFRESLFTSKLVCEEKIDESDYEDDILM